ncbi:uncharacterized protein LOC128547870 isoform X2 [Mercenaria mercenaria]|uniref:uncharacterized protein LOC128547870 isoform X2 n=1 Tax=Mercenaria mercenaria TaxID=6596 RepID=UPI00234EB77E|nr:uncharacterized protein LOC128547870 isoform X2 [Mercenaria mercenaria]
MTDLQINVTEQQCGRTVDLAVETRLILDYDGGDLGKKAGELCVITIQNSDSDKMICVETDSARSFACSLIFSYYIGDYPSSSGFLGNGRTCYDFSWEPLCDRRTPVFASFQSVAQILAAYVHVEIYVTPVTTTQLVVQKTTTWSSFQYTDDSNSMGLTIGLCIGGVVLLLSFAACAYARQKSTFESQGGQRFNVQYQQGNQPRHQQFVSSVPQQYSQNTTVSQISTQDPNLAGYHVHPTVSLTLSDQQQSTTGQNNSLPVSAPVDPSAPPPPYPGY